MLTHAPPIPPLLPPQVAAVAKETAGKAAAATKDAADKVGT